MEEYLSTTVANLVIILPFIYIVMSPIICLLKIMVQNINDKLKYNPKNNLTL